MDIKIILNTFAVFLSSLAFIISVFTYYRNRVKTVLEREQLASLRILASRAILSKIASGGYPNG